MVKIALNVLLTATYAPICISLCRWENGGNWFLYFWLQGREKNSFCCRSILSPKSISWYFTYCIGKILHHVLTLRESPPLLGKFQNGASRQTLSIERLECWPHCRQKSTLTHSGSSTGSPKVPQIFMADAFGELGHHVVEKYTVGLSRNKPRVLQYVGLQLGLGEEIDLSIYPSNYW